MALRTFSISAAEQADILRRLLIFSMLA